MAINDKMRGNRFVALIHRLAGKDGALLYPQWWVVDVVFVGGCACARFMD